MMASGRPATINNITRDDVVAWHKKYWGASSAILVAAGAGDAIITWYVGFYR